MCKTLLVGGEYAALMRDLVEKVGRDNVVFHDGYLEFGDDLFQPDCCLCPVDHERTAEKAGVVITLAEY